MIFLEVSFYLCLLAIGYTYILYPWGVNYYGKNYKENDIIYSKEVDWPKVAVVMSAFNEEAIIEKKVNTVFETSYPLSKLSFLIGSDCSSDGTDDLLRSLSNKYENLEFHRFDYRQGKANVLNALLENMSDDIEIVVLTDANVLFLPSTLENLVKHFKNEKIGQVAANIRNYNISSDEIAAEEEFYINRENLIKHSEGKIWGATMGAFGACYAIRKSLVPKLPTNFLMEDFFISLNVLKNDFKAILPLDAVVMEDIPGMIDQEFKRKRRISAGNFQNLAYYFKHFVSHFYPNGFVFLSHKILRWLGPFFILGMIFSVGLLATVSSFYYLLLLVGFALLGLVILDWFFQKSKLYFKPLRLLRYFIYMNMALLAGFFLYLKGVKTNAWQPTIRKK